MASKSVTFAVTANPSGARNFLRIGGELQPGFAGVNNPTYTVPAGKRLVVRTKSDVEFPSEAGRIVLNPSPVADLPQKIHVFSGGLIVEFRHTAGSVLGSGFLEDDI